MLGGIIETHKPQLADITTIEAELAHIRNRYNENARRSRRRARRGLEALPT